MKSSSTASLLFFLFFLPVFLTAQETVPVTFKVFPNDYQVFFRGSRLPFQEGNNGLRMYELPSGKIRLTISSYGWLPQTKDLLVEAETRFFSTKLEPRNSRLVLLSEARTGKHPRGLAFNADSTKLLVSNEKGIDVFSTSALKQAGTVQFPDRTEDPAFTDVLLLKDLGEIWGVQPSGRIQIFDSLSLQFKEAWTWGPGGNATLSDLGSGTIALSNWDEGSQILIAAKERKATGQLTTPGSPRGFSANGSAAFVSLFDTGRLLVIDQKSWAVRDTLKIGGSPRPVGATQNRLFVGDMAEGRISAFALPENELLKTIQVGANPQTFSLSPDRKLLAFATRGRNNPQDYRLPGPEFGTVGLVDIASATVVATVWGRNQPTGLVFSSDGAFLAFSDYLDDNVELYRVD